MKNERKDYQMLLKGAALLGAVLIAGCAGDRTLAAEKLASAQNSVNYAKTAATSTDGAAELKSADDKLAQAQAAMDEEDYDRARRLAESASVDADLARAKASTAKSQKAADKMRETVRTLKRELDQSQ